MTANVLVIATGNQHKLAEITAILHEFGLGVELRGLRDYPGCPEVVEDGATLEANATKKAREVCAWTGAPTLADDTGLEVDALHGAPGIHSARYAGPGAGERANNDKLLHALADVPDPDRAARYRCAMVYLRRAEDPAPIVVQGAWEGTIGRTARGEGGFGYDPLFLVDAGARTAAELSADDKNRRSHRGQAVAALMTDLRRELLRTHTTP